MTDNPVTLLSADLFGFRPYVEEVNELVRHADPLPLTVGVFGSWGSGKSSFLRMWQDLLKGSPLYRTVWFNPWKYDQKVDVWAALLQSLLAAVDVEQTPSEKIGKLARTATWLTLKGGAGIAASYASGGVVGADRVDQVVTALSSANSRHYAEVNRFEIDFADAVNTLLGPEGRLYVFVDDLDRCTPDAAVGVLEALKLFIGDARCVFVLAMDFDVLTSIAGAKFGAGLAIDGAAYLEKIVQLPFHLPDIGMSAIHEAFAGSLGEAGSDRVLWELIKTGFGRNPRRIKRFINIFNLARAVLYRDTTVSPTVSRTQTLHLAVLLIVRSEHRDFFRLLRDDPGAWQRFSASKSLPNVFVSNQLLHDLLLREDFGPPTAAEVTRMLATVQLTPAVGS